MAETPENERMSLREYQRHCQGHLPGVFRLWVEDLEREKAELEESLLFMKEQRSIAEEALRQWEGNYVDLRAEMDGLEERVEHLEHLREIAIDIEACLDSRIWPMQFIREAFRDAISRTATSELKKEQEGDG